MAPLDNEGRRLEIDFFLGDLRRRIRNISTGTVGEFYYDNILNQPPLLNVLSRVDDYSPDEIVQSLTPILRQIERIDDVVLNYYKKETYDFYNPSQYEMISREIEVYKFELRRILNEYKDHLGIVANGHTDDTIQPPLANYKYQYFLVPGSDRQLKKFRDALDSYIDSISDQAFLNIFSGTETETTRKINWKRKQKNLCAYFIVELSRIMGFPKWDHIWLVASKYITFDGQRITSEFRTNYKPNKIGTLRGKSDIDRALEIFSSPPEP